jgi:hypothetical protein
MGPRARCHFSRALKGLPRFAEWVGMKVRTHVKTGRDANLFS